MLNCKVKEINPDAPSVTLESGATFSADLIIGADGIHSTVRGSVIGHNTLPLVVPTGDMAYRAVVSTEHFLADPDLRDLVENPRVNCWMGPLKHIIGYCIRDRKEFNLVMLGPDDESTYSWTAKGDASEVKANFGEWEPRIQKIISHIKDVLKTKLVLCAPLKTWTHGSGKVTLMGDACHPMLPYRAQGAAMAIEDGAVLGNLFSRLQSRSQIPMLVKAYEEIRYRRATDMQTGSMDNRRLFHMSDGPEQQARDAAMLLAMENATKLDGHNDPSSNPTPWADKSKNKEHFGYDADEVTERWWNMNYRSGRIQVLANL
ncbi:hypothetical protein AAF712_005789 [Marasmius tenuissimus]|uniref:FAD-binding domain-containing protein n=1 Tax=Marasmius tenuissimus TaxID=585030 RepID=A0ABR3A1G7_9AGAR